MKRYISLLLLAFAPFALFSQNNDGKEKAKGGYDDFRSSMLEKFNKSQNEMLDKYKSFREEALKGYIDFMRKSWEKMEGSKPVPAPVIDPVPPVVRDEDEDAEREKEQELLRQKELELKKEQELQRQKELELQKQKELELQRKKELEEQRRKEQEALRQKELELLRQKELELQRQKEQEEQRRKEQEALRQKELELQRQKEQEQLKQKELEQLRKKELELQRQKELEEQRQKELEEQRRKEQEALRQRELELQRQKELEEQRQKELEEQRRKEQEALRQKELELQRQQELLKQKELELQRQKELELEKQKENAKPVEIVMPPFNVKPQPQPIAPIEVKPSVFEKYVECKVFGTPLKVRYDATRKVTLAGVSENAVADAIEKMAGEQADKLIVDCIAIRDSKSLSDWAYINMLKEITTAVYGSYSNSAVLLMAYIYMQSGYKMRLATNNDRLYMLYASEHTLFGKDYYVLDGYKFYSLDELPQQLNICKASWPAEETLSLLIAGNQHFDAKTDKEKRVASTKYKELDVNVKVNNNLLNFYSTYPKSMLNNNLLSTWAMYANVPMDSSVVAQVYPTLKAQVDGLPKLEAVNKLLHFVQTGLVYKYDNEVWGCDRPFFPEESLYYDYADCEDRSILFTRLVRDLLDVEAVLIYVPGHLLSAVRLTDDIKGEFILVDGRKFMLCEPTCLNGAPVGWSNIKEGVKMQAVQLK